MRDLAAGYLLLSTFGGTILGLLFLLLRLLLNEQRRSYGRPEIAKPEWVDSDWFVIASLVLAWPFGLGVLWASPWDGLRKRVATAVMCTAVVAAFLIASSGAEV